jgi:hypothetical protein
MDTDREERLLIGGGDQLRPDVVEIVEDLTIRIESRIEALLHREFFMSRIDLLRDTRVLGHVFDTQPINILPR